MEHMRFLTLLLILVFMPVVTVKADDSCVNLYDIDNITYSSYESGGFYYVSAYLDESAGFLSLDTSTSYVFWFNDFSLPFSDYGTIRIVYLAPGYALDYISDLSLTYYSFTPSYSGSNYGMRFQFIRSSYASEFLSKLESGEVVPHLSVGTEPCVVDDDTTDDTPIYEADTSMNGFYTMYVSKLTSLSNYFVTNQYLIYFIGIFLLFICLELFLLIFRRW